MLATNSYLYWISSGADEEISQLKARRRKSLFFNLDIMIMCPDLEEELGIQYIDRDRRDG